MPKLSVIAAIGGKMAAAMARCQDFDIWWLVAEDSVRAIMACGHCGRRYQRLGNLRRHLWRLGHYEGLGDA